MENEGQVEGVGIIRSVWRLLVLLFSLSAHSKKMFLIIVLAFFRTLFLSHFRNIGASTIRYIYVYRYSKRFPYACLLLLFLSHFVNKCDTLNI